MADSRSAWKEQRIDKNSCEHDQNKETDQEGHARPIHIFHFNFLLLQMNIISSLQETAACTKFEI
jgi:hypothetical protein